MLGKGGAAATLLLIFMAVTSASSAEYIAVSRYFALQSPDIICQSLLIVSVSLPMTYMLRSYISELSNPIAHFDRMRLS